MLHLGGLREELIPPSVVEGLRTVSGLRQDRGGREKDPVGAVPDDVVEKTLARIPARISDRGHGPTATARGLAAGELLRLTPDAIDRTTDPWTYRPKRHKSQHHNRGRIVFFGPKGRGDPRTDPGLEGGGARLFRATRCSYWRSIGRACDRAYPHPTLAGFHERELTTEQARAGSLAKGASLAPQHAEASAATEVRREYGLEGAQVILGHARANITETYAERDMDKAREIARKLG